MSEDTYFVLFKYTSRGWQYATPDEARKRWEVVSASLRATLGGTILAHHVTMGNYDGVISFSIPSGQDFKLFQCLRILRGPGDIEIEVLRAWPFEQFAPK